MAIKVTKFGGSSLASAQQILKMQEIVEADEARKFVVPSAPGKRFSDDIKVTDLLYALHDAASHFEETEKIYAQIVKRYTDIRDELGISFDIEAHLEKMYGDIKKGANEDYAASRGEYLNGLLIADLLGYDFVDAADVIFFDENGAYDPKKTLSVLPGALKVHERAVIPGFYGTLPNGKIKTFSRGGSDITGSIVARAANADLYENWTDVSGFMMADPRIVENPKKIDVVTYRELRELAYMGASVLHDEAIFPVRCEGIPINIRNTNDPSAPGTMIVESTCKKPKYTITGIAGKKGFAAINIEKDRMNSEVGFGRKVLSVFEDNGISFEHIPSGIDTMSVFVHQSDFEEKEQKVLAGIHRAVSPDYLDMEADLALIAVVGRGMKSTRGTAGRIFSALAHANINIRMIDQGSSELNIIIGVSNSDFEKAIRAIYDIFVTVRL